MESGGRLVPNLEESDFEVFDNNRPQPLTVFDNSPRPLSIALMLDTSFSMSANLARLKDAAEQFLIRLFPKDQAKVGAFNDGVTIGSTFSSDRDILIADMRALDFGNGTRLFDGIDLAIAHLEPVEGRKVVVVFTDGDDTGSRSANRGSIIDRARLKDVMVYAIGFQSEYFDGARVQRSKPDSGLRRIAEETGGGYFELTKASELGATFTRVAQELHSQYALGFTAPELDNKVHTLT
jgi:Ca-activated chloride channel family protein